MRRIEDLYPGEAALNEEIVASYLKTLSCCANGESATTLLPPVIVANVNGRTHVTDGNHRARALVEFCSERDLDPEKLQIRCTVRTTPLHQNYLPLLRGIAQTYGRGLPAFGRVLKVAAGEYLQAQGREDRQLRGE